MTTDELKAMCRAKAEEVARPHSSFCVHMRNSIQARHCIGTCGRDEEVLRIAAALEAMYEAGRVVGYSDGRYETRRSFYTVEPDVR